MPKSALTSCCEHTTIHNHHPSFGCVKTPLCFYIRQKRCRQGAIFCLVVLLLLLCSANSSAQCTQRLMVWTANVYNCKFYFFTHYTVCPALCVSLYVYEKKSFFFLLFLCAKSFSTNHHPLTPPPPKPQHRPPWKKLIITFLHVFFARSLSLSLWVWLIFIFVLFFIFHRLGVPGMGWGDIHHHHIDEREKCRSMCCSTQCMWRRIWWWLVECKGTCTHEKKKSHDKKVHLESCYQIVCRSGQGLFFPHPATLSLETESGSMCNFFWMDSFFWNLMIVPWQPA